MSNILIYPCTAGTGRPVGFHNFVATQGGVVCSLCGLLPFQTPTLTWPYI